MAGLRQWVSGRIDEFKGAFKKFGAEDGALIAAAISFYGLLTLLPILLLGVAVLGFVVGSSDKAFDTVVSFFNSFMPTSTFVVETLRGLVRARGTIGWIGIVSLLWTGSQFFVTVQTSMDGIWEVGAKPGYIKTRVKGIVMLIVFGVFLMISVASSSLTSLLQHWQATGGFASAAVADLLSALAFVISLLFSIAMFLVVYRWEPDTSVRWRSAIYGAVFAGVAWTIAKELYRLYLEHLANFSKLYGSLGSVIILILWIYYSSMIMVLGAELAYVNEHGPSEEPEEAERLEKGSQPNG